MFNHALHDYVCPICLGVQENENAQTLLKKSDIVFSEVDATIFINSFFIKGNEGHLIIVPNNHYEHLYDLPEEVGHKIFDYAKKFSIIMKKAYNCDGITLQQNNEPAGGQHAFHFHLHLFPRYNHDVFYENVKNKLNTTPHQRMEYVVKLKSFI